MIQRIYKYADVKFYVDGDNRIANKFIIKFYTTDKEKAIIRTADDVILFDNKRYIKINWKSLKLLDSGILNYEVNNLADDHDYDDGVFNETYSKTTHYYIFNDTNSVDEIENINNKIDEIVVDLSEKINNESIRAQGAEADLAMDIQQEIRNRKSDSEFLNNQINAEAEERNEADEAIKNEIKKLVKDVKVDGQSVVTNNVANIYLYGKADKTDLDQEKANRISNVNKLKEQINNEYSARQTMDNSIIAAVNNEIARAKKAESDEKSARINKDANLEKRVGNLENQTTWDCGTY